MKNLHLLKRRIGSVVSLTILVALWVRCQAYLPESATPSLTAPSFTYSTANGAIWQIDVEGNRTLLLPEDDIQKWFLSWSPDRRYLAYVSREFLQVGEQEMADTIEATLMVIEHGATAPRQLAESAQDIRFSWIDDHTINLQVTHQITRDQQQQWQYFSVDVESGIAVSITQENGETVSMPSLFSPNDQWSLQFENDEKWIYLFLLDDTEEKVTVLYQQPVGKNIIAQWSPDSRYVLYFGYTFPGSDDIYVYDVTTRKETQVTHFIEQGEDSFSIGSPKWSPSADWIFFPLDTTTHTNQPCLIHISEGYLRCYDVMSKTDQFIWSADGHYLAFLGPRGEEPVDLYVIDAKEEEMRNLTQDGQESIEEWIAP